MCQYLALCKTVMGYTRLVALYRRQDGRKDDSGEFYGIVQDVVSNRTRENCVIVAVEFPAHVPHSSIRLTMESYSERTGNRFGRRLIAFDALKYFRITDTFIPHKEIYTGALEYLSQ